MMRGRRPRHSESAALALEAKENWVQYRVRLAWGSHPRVRFARINTGVGWFNDAGPCRKSDPGARPVRFNPKGTADLVGLIKPGGRMLMIECKRADGGKLSPEQEVMKRVVTDFGGLFIEAHSVEDVDRVLIPLVGPR